MSIRARIFFVFVTAIIAGFALLANWISNDVADRYSESFEEVMVDAANLLAEIITTEINAGNTELPQLRDAFQRVQLRRFSAQVYELEKTSVDIHIYVTDAKGIVIFDSDQGKAVGEDYSNWRDVYKTLRGDYGARATKVADTVSTGDPNQQLTIAYVAAPIYQQGNIVGVATIAKPKNNTDRFVANAKANLLKAVLFSVALALLLGMMLYIWVSRPLQALADYANSVSRGERVSVPQLGNNEIGNVGSAMDSMRQALEDKQYVERYVQSITHEIKSPLTAIQASAELLEQDLPAEKRQQFAATILEETHRLNDFADQLLQLAALEKSQSIEKVEPIDLADIASSIVQTHSPVCETRQLVIIKNLASEANIQGDPLLIRQAIDNLFRNAISFSPAGGTIEITVQAQDHHCLVDITDQGPGVPKFAQARIFERFYSLPRPDSGQKSSGLGLNFSLEVAHLHGGTLTLENLSLDNQHSGTLARLSLPMKMA